MFCCPVVVLHLCFFFARNILPVIYAARSQLPGRCMFHPMEFSFACGLRPEVWSGSESKKHLHWQIM